jgi:hypothetical protein
MLTTARTQKLGIASNTRWSKWHVLCGSRSGHESARITGQTKFPGHFRPLKTDGETTEDLKPQENQAKFEREATNWRRAKIKEIEEERTEHADVLVERD